MAFSTGALVREKGNNGGPFLHQVAKAIGAKSFPQTSPKADRLNFSLVILATGMSRAGNGELGAGFVQSPPGDWMTTKAFLPSGDEDAEVFINLNPKLRVGEFSPKDPEYGDRVIAALAKIFLP
jgi:hypothetical protein